MDKDDDGQRVAMIFLVVLVGAVIAGVITFAVLNAMGHSESVPPAAAVAEEMIPEPVGEALAKVYFEVGQSALSGEANGELGKVIAAAQADTGKIVLVSGFHDASGDPAQNAELAKQRAVGVRDALAASGIAADRIKLRKPEKTMGEGTAAEARRVELRVQ